MFPSHASDPKPGLMAHRVGSESLSHHTKENHHESRVTKKGEAIACEQKDQ